jgi:hypothetical protein
MYSDPIEAKYFADRLQNTLNMASQSDNAPAVLAHLGLAACYRDKLTSLLRIEVKLRATLPLGAFRDKSHAGGVGAVS